MNDDNDVSDKYIVERDLVQLSVMEMRRMQVRLSVGEDVEEVEYRRDEKDE